MESGSSGAELSPEDHPAWWEGRLHLLVLSLRLDSLYPQQPGKLFPKERVLQEGRALQGLGFLQERRASLSHAVCRPCPAVVPHVLTIPQTDIGHLFPISTRMRKDGLTGK